MSLQFDPSKHLVTFQLDRQQQTLLRVAMRFARQLAHVYLRSSVGCLCFYQAVGEGYGCHHVAAKSVRSSSPASYTPTLINRPSPFIHRRALDGPTVECDGCNGSTSDGPTDAGPYFLL